MTENCMVNNCQKRLLEAEITRLRNENSELANHTIAQQPPMLADIAQIIDAGWKSGKSAADVAGEILREFDAPAQCALTAQGALEIAANIAEDRGWMGKPYPGVEIAKAIRDVAKKGYWTRSPRSPMKCHCTMPPTGPGMNWMRHG